MHRLCIKSEENVIIKHLYQRQITSKGKKIKVWYYWYWMDGKQVRKSCGRNGKVCITKKEAEQYIASITDEELDSTLKSDTITLQEYCNGMYDNNSEFVRYEESKNRKFTPSTWRIKKHYLNELLKKYGNRKIAELKPRELDLWITNLDFSASTRNQFLVICEDIFKRLYKDGLIQTMPMFERCTVNDTKEKGILTKEEIDFLFPENFDAIKKIWTTGKRMIFPEYFHFAFATYIYLILSTGLRSGEARALKDEQFINNNNMILLNAMIDADGNRVNHLKKGNEKKPKWRVCLVPEKTKKMISYMKSIIPQSDRKTDYFIEMHGKPLTKWFTNNHFKQVLRQNGIDVDGRNISAHSLRFTYNTMMRNQIEDDNLRLLLGHDSKKMTDYYDKSKITDHLDKLLNDKPTVDSVWN